MSQRRGAFLMIAVLLLATGSRMVVAQEKILYSFGATGTDSKGPQAGLIADAKGNFYGTTTAGGVNSKGTVFELIPGTGGTWTEKVLYSFGATSTDGATPYSSLIFDASGNLYGTTEHGGGTGVGTVFELTPGTGGSWTEKVLYSFAGGEVGDGALPFGGVIFDSKGNLYGTTTEGADGGGIVFELSPGTGGSWTEQVLYSFPPEEGGPEASLLFDSSGNLYGTASDGGTNGTGAVFELIPVTGGSWTEQVLYGFGTTGTDGTTPYGSLIFNGKNLYGTTQMGGANGTGTVFELIPGTGGTWTEKILYSFGSESGDGAYPNCGLILDSSGDLYGTTTSGGSHGSGSNGGTVFELISGTGGTWTEKVLYNFYATLTDATQVNGNLLRDASGNLYGTTTFGGPNGAGTAYEITATSTPTAATPVFSPAAGTYTSTQSVTITDTTSKAIIYYTTDDSTPTTGSFEYGGAIPVSETETIKAIAVASGYTNSAVASATYTITPPAASPIFTPGAGTYTSAQSVTITDATSGATIYYTTNGTTPATSSTKYTSGISVSSTETIKAIAIATGFSQSAVASATYTIATTAPAGLQFIPVTPCRIVDTRWPTGPFGGPEMAAGTSRSFDIPQSACSIPSTAVAYSLNVTVVPSGFLSYLTLWPTGQTQPYVSTLNSDGRVKANAAITPAGTNGGVSVYVSDATNVILDIDGYFVPAGTASALAFYPLTPCRVADTRQATGPLGGPFISANTSRAFPVQSGSCNIPSTAKAYSLNVTAVPHKTLNYLTSWPTGETQPYVSTLNSSTGAVTANAAVVPAGTSGAVSIFVSDDADVILDVNGYFAPPATGGLSLYTVTPCRVIDTRSGAGAFNGVLAVDVETSSCAPPSTAQGYVLNATVVPPGSLDYLTLWPAGEAQPYVSTLNALDGAITSNMAIVPTTNGSVDAFSSNLTNLILDLSSYFAP